MLLVSSSVSASYRSAKMRTASTSHHQICLPLSTFPLVSTDKLSLLPPAANSFTCVLGPPCPLIFWHSLTLQYLIAHLLHRFSFFFPTGSFSLAYKHGAIVSIFKRKTFPLLYVPFLLPLYFSAPPDSTIRWKRCLDLLCPFSPCHSF